VQHSGKNPVTSERGANKERERANPSEQGESGGVWKEGAIIRPPEALWEIYTINVGEGAKFQVTDNRTDDLNPSWGSRP
jgi:hypothetical protein